MQSTFQDKDETTCVEIEDCFFYDSFYEPGTIVELSDDFIADKLIEVESEMHKIPHKLKEAYLFAVEQEIMQRVEYTKNKKIMMSFLRAESFDASRAGLRLAKFFNFKLEVFGPEMILLRIRQNDLNENERKILSSGLIHFGGVDCGGRVVIFFQCDRVRSMDLLNDHTVKSIARVFFYLGSFDLPFAQGDENRWERNEAVLIFWDFNSTLSLEESRSIFFPIFQRCVEAFPLKVTALHYCYSNVVPCSWLHLLQPRTSQKCKNKIKYHQLSAAESLSELSKYGINVECLPIEANGEFKFDYHQKQLELMKTEEDAQFKSDSYDSTEQDNKQWMTTTREIQNRQSEEISNETESNLPVIVENVNTEPSDDSSDADPPLQQLVQRNRQKIRLLPEEHLPKKLMSIMERKTNLDAIWWSRSGNAFVIDKEKFASKVLPIEFKGIQMDSFLRRLRRWGFRRLPHNHGKNFNCIEHENHLFRKDSPHLLKEWKNIIAKDKFPVRLRKILERCTSLDGCWWVSDGKAFAIEKERFSCEILNEYFDGLKFDSFYRLLKRWGFVRWQDGWKSRENALVFFHALFQKDLPLTQELLEKWTCQNYEKGENFPHKLYRLLSTKKALHAIWWIDKGNAFAIQTISFTRDVLSNEFKGIKFASFHRSLIRWGFTRLQFAGSTPNVVMFQHPSFKMNSPEFLMNWPKPGDKKKSARKDEDCSSNHL